MACVTPLPAVACEPILPLFQLLSGPTAAGASILRLSLLGLALAVAIKSALFAFLERRLTWRSAVLYMLLANVVSTIPGIFVAACVASVGGIVVALPVMILLAWFVGNRPTAQTKWAHLGAGTIALAFTGFFFVSVLIYGIALVALNNDNFASYWFFKFVFVTLVACTGIAISAVLEECVVARMSRKSLGKVYFYTSVFRANYITLGLILLVAALRILPQRLDAPHFIVSWLHNLSAMLGLA